MNVTLTRDELLQAVIVGSNRRITSLHRKQATRLAHYVSEDNSEWSTEIESCGAELSYARVVDRYWSGGIFSGSVARADVAGVQIRHTHYPTGHLLLYPEDSDADTFVLVTGRSPDFTIVGSILGVRGKLPRFWKPDALSPSWWVPQSELIPFGRSL